MVLMVVLAVEAAASLLLPLHGQQVQRHKHHLLGELGMVTTGVLDTITTAVMLWVAEVEAQDKQDKTAAVGLPVEAEMVEPRPSPGPLLLMLVVVVAQVQMAVA
jgi:hypothetical protein